MADVWKEAMQERENMPDRCISGVAIRDGICTKCGADQTAPGCGELRNETHPQGLELLRLRAINAELARALEESDGALTMLAEFTGAPDECDSDAFGLCGLPICEQVGCLCSKRDANRDALARHKEQS